MHEKMIDNPHIRTIPHGVTLASHLLLYHNKLPVFDPLLPLVAATQDAFCGNFRKKKFLRFKKSKEMADAVRREETCYTYINIKVYATHLYCMHTCLGNICV